jgi:hypothetical protein
MTPFRQPVVRTLEVQPVAPASASWLVRGGLIGVAAGVLTLCAGALLTAFSVGGADTGLILMGSGVAVAFVGSWAAWVGYRVSTLIVRVSVTEGELSLDWREGGRVKKRERVSLSDVVEVVVTDSPSSSGGSYYGLALGMKNGEIVFSINSQGVQQCQHCVRECTRLAEFLGVPARTPT